ncbi:MAG: response regulator [Brucella anthropi]
MADFLIVEDDVHKREQLVSFLKSRDENATVKQEVSLIGGIRALRSLKLDCVVLDMTLPNYDPENDGHIGSVLAFGGVEFLKQARRFKLETPVVVITQFETFGDDENAKDRKELENDLRQNFPSIFKGMVYYHASLNDWSEELSFLLDEILQENHE